MKQFFLFALGRWLLVAGALASLPVVVRAQCTVNTPPCAVPFTATDVLTGQEVQTLCVGRAVRLAPACGRVVPAELLYYNALPTPNLATTTTPAACNFVPGRLPSNVYTPTAAGPVTIAELANTGPIAGGGVGTGTVFVRNFQVLASTPPTFTLYACQNNTISITITDASYDQYFVQVNGSPTLVGPLVAGSTTIIAGPAGGSVTLIGRYRANGLCEGRATQTVPTLAAPLTPVLSQLTTSAPLPGSLVLAVGSLSAGYKYDVQRADGSSPTGFRRVTAVAEGSTSITLSNAPAGQYRVGRRDFCNTDSAFSTLVPTILLSSVSVNNVNTLSWQTAGPVASYTLLRNGTALATLPAAATSYADAAVSCGTRYVYQLQATVAPGSQAVSNTTAVSTVSTLPPPAPLLNASFTLTNQIVLSATQAGGAALAAGGQLYYSRQGGLASLDFGVVPVAVDTLRDPAAFADLRASPPCYTVRLQDICGNTSLPSPPTCPSLLAVAAADADGLITRLSWSAFRGPGSPALGASYRVISLAADGTVLATSAPTAGLDYLDLAPPTSRQILRYRVEASGAGLPAGTVSYSNVASLTRQPRLVVPNAFTPNGDGLNDVLELKGRYLSGFTFVVVDRNGQEVFRATDRTQAWDGTIQGHAPVNAAYVWRLTMQDEAGQPFSQTGTVTILK